VVERADPGAANFTETFTVTFAETFAVKAAVQTAVTTTMHFAATLALHEANGLDYSHADAHCPDH
jgi:hypothetical protein